MKLDSGRVAWRVCLPASVTSWSELARDYVLPPAHIPTVFARAGKVQPGYTSPEFRAALAERLGSNLTEVEIDCDHMIEQARPAETAALISRVL